MMKAAIIFALLLTTVLCRPARRTFSSSESSEEQVKLARAKEIRALMLPQETAVQKVRVSDDSAVTSEEEAVVDMVSAVKSAITGILSESVSLPDPSVTPDTASDQSQDDADDDDDDNSEDTEENESEEDESGEPSTPSPVTGTTVMAVGTEEPTTDSTPEPITPTVVIDQGRGDSLGRYPSDYKSILYGEGKSYQKVPSPYKSYEIMEGVKKMAYDMTNGNEVEKGLKVYKALQVHADLLEEDTSTPEVESQGLDASFVASSPDQASPKQALLPNAQELPSDASPTDSSSATDEEAEESTASPSDSTSASDESEDSEDATATPGAADSQSDESDSVEGDSEEDGAVAPDNATDMPMLAK